MPPTDAELQDHYFNPNKRPDEQRIGWRPIATAPKSPDINNGVELLGWCPRPGGRAGDHRIIWWEPMMLDGKGCWWGDEDSELHPTLWQPLPERPIQGV